MRTDQQPLSSVLVSPVPGDDGLRTILFAFRRMAAHGLHDAHASHRLLGQFGVHARRIAVLLRTVVHTLSRQSTQPITIAPCCCTRMTPSESLLIGALISTRDGPHPAACDALQRMMGHSNVEEAMTVFAVLSAALMEARQSRPA